MADDVRYIAPSAMDANPACYDAVALHRRVSALRAATAGQFPPSPWRHVGLITLRGAGATSAAEALVGEAFVGEACVGEHCGDEAAGERLAPRGVVVEARSSVVLWRNPTDGGDRVALRRWDAWRRSPRGWRLVRRVVQVSSFTVPAWAAAMLW